MMTRYAIDTALTKLLTLAALACLSKDNTSSYFAEMQEIKKKVMREGFSYESEEIQRLKDELADTKQQLGFCRLELKAEKLKGGIT